MSKTHICVPSEPHPSKSTNGELHVDKQHKEIYDNGVVADKGRCEGGQHDTGWVGTFVDFFSSKK